MTSDLTHPGTGAGHAPSPLRERFRVLAVDDDPDLLSLTKRVLEQAHGLHVDTASNALDACRVLRDRPVDCVVSDYRMPAVDGLDLLEVLREEDDTTLLPFVMFTNKGSEKLAARVRAVEAADYVEKDRGLEQYDALAAAVRRVIADSDAREHGPVARDAGTGADADGAKDE
jgi:CheY-like chemotaxis protein